MNSIFKEVGLEFIFGLEERIICGGVPEGWGSDGKGMMLDLGNGGQKVGFGDLRL